MIKPAGSLGPHDADALVMLDVRNGDSDAFDELVDRYQDRVRSLITRLMNGAAYADDLTQQVFLRAYQARDTYRPTARFSSWLYTIAGNVVRNAKRGLSRQQETQNRWQANQLAPIGMMGEAEASPSARMQRREVGDTVRKALTRLNDRHQRAIQLVYLSGVDHQEAAEQMGMSDNAFKSLVHRAREAARRVLEPEFGCEFRTCEPVAARR